MIIGYVEELCDVNCGSKNVLDICIAVPYLQMTQVLLYMVSLLTAFAQIPQDT